MFLIDFHQMIGNYMFRVIRFPGSDSVSAFVKAACKVRSARSQYAIDTYRIF